MADIRSNFNRLPPSSLTNWLDSSLIGSRAILPRTVLARQATSRQVLLESLAKEPEDARLTGGTRSLDRRLLALNFDESPAKSVPGVDRLPRRPAAA